MKKLILNFALIIGLLTSCSQRIEKKLIGTYWFEPESEEILYFDKNGILYETANQEKSIYSLVSDSLRLNISGWGTDFYSIREITKDKLILVSSKNNVWEFKPAQYGDFLVGEWEGRLFNKEMSFEFSEGDLTIENYNASLDEDNIIYDDFYRVEENKIITSSEVYIFNFELSEDKNELKLIQGEKQNIFKRN